MKGPGSAPIHNDRLPELGPVPSNVRDGFLSAAGVSYRKTGTYAGIRGEPAPRADLPWRISGSWRASLLLRRGCSSQSVNKMFIACKPTPFVMLTELFKTAERVKILYYVMYRDTFAANQVSKETGQLLFLLTINSQSTL